MAKYSLILLLCSANSVLVILANQFGPSSNFPLEGMTEVRVTKRKAPGIPANFESNDMLADELSDKYEYDVKLKVMEAIQHLKLKPSESIFTPGFKLGIIGADPSGEITFSDQTPSKELIRAIEENVYVDPAADAALILRDVNGEFHLDGFVNGARIKREERGHFISARQLGSLPGPQEPAAWKDAVDNKRPIAMLQGFSLDKPVEIISEVVVLFDLATGANFGGDYIKALEYAKILFSAVNNRFSTSPDPKITFHIAGIHVVKLKSTEGFIEAGKTDNGYSLNTILQHLSKWVYETKRDLFKFDILVLLTGVQSNDTSQSGAAFFKGACFHGKEDYQRAESVIVSIDNGWSWSGAYTLVHELATNLGSDHDGERSSADCAMTDGYIMSYKGWGQPDRFAFSECSRRQMKIFIGSTGGACLWSLEPENIVSGRETDTDTAHELLNMNLLCQKALGDIQAKLLDPMLLFTSPDEQCQVIRCHLKGFVYNLTGSVPNNAWPCGRDGKCAEGVCLNNTENPQDLLNMTIMCQKKFPDLEGVMLDNDRKPNEQCEPTLWCRTSRNLYSASGYMLPEHRFPCGKGGYCSSGACVHTTGDSSRDWLDLDVTCRRKYLDEGAYMFRGDRTPDEHCRELWCGVPSDNDFYIIPGFKINKYSYPCGKTVAGERSGTCTEVEGESKLKCVFPPPRSVAEVYG